MVTPIKRLPPSWWCQLLVQSARRVTVVLPAAQGAWNNIVRVSLVLKTIVLVANLRLYLTISG